MVAPPFGVIGGPERVAKNLAEALFKREDIDVTLFAPADWNLTMTHISTLEESLWNMADFEKQTARERSGLIIYSQLKVLKYEQNFDIIHVNSQSYAYLIAKMTKKPVVLTLHNPPNKREFNQLESAGVKTVFLLESQRGSLKSVATIWNGVPVQDIEYSLKKGSYLVAVGRIADQKGIDAAIEIAKKANKKLLIFGRTGNSEKRSVYFREKIAPFIDDKRIIYKKEVSHREILEYLKNAEALLFPIKRPEGCPMAVAEALACGTPVVGTLIGALPEILKNKKVAYLSNDINKLVEAAKNTDQFDRKECRKYAEENFSSAVMAEKYVEVYKRLIK